MSGVFHRMLTADAVRHESLSRAASAGEVVYEQVGKENPDHGPCVQDPLTHSVIYHQDADGYLWGVKLSEVTMDRDGAAWFSAESCS